MPTRPLADSILDEPLWLALAALALAGAAILAALGFEHLGGYQPCALCLMQRTPYYIGIPVLALAALAAWRQAAAWLTALLFAIAGALFVYNAGLAVYHAGVEWRFWEGPAGCAPSVGVGSAADMLDQLAHTRPPSCTDAGWRLLGLSFAGWNVLLSATLAVLGFLAAARSLRRPG